MQKDFVIDRSAMIDESNKIWQLFRQFDSAVWVRIDTSFDTGKEKFDAYRNLADDVNPKSADEIAIWNQLASPENRDALKQYVASFPVVTDYAKKLFNALIADSDRRAGTESGAGERDGLGC